MGMSVRLTLDMSLTLNPMPTKAHRGNVGHVIHDAVREARRGGDHQHRVAGDRPPHCLAGQPVITTHLQLRWANWGKFKALPYSTANRRATLLASRCTTRANCVQTMRDQSSPAQAMITCWTF